MDCASVLICLERFQTAIVGVIGFGGVIATLWHNAILAERERRHRIAHERETLRVALLQELSITRNTIQENIGMLEKAIERNVAEENGTGAMVPLWRMTDAYDAFLPKLGLLGAKWLHNVMYAYLTLKDLPAKLPLIPNSTVHGQHLFVEARSLQALAETWRRVLPDIDNAIRSLSKEASA